MDTKQNAAWALSKNATKLTKAARFEKAVAPHAAAAKAHREASEAYRLLSIYEPAVKHRRAAERHELLAAAYR